MWGNKSRWSLRNSFPSPVRALLQARSWEGMRVGCVPRWNFTSVSIVGQGSNENKYRVKFFSRVFDFVDLLATTSSWPYAGARTKTQGTKSSVEGNHWRLGVFATLPLARSVVAFGAVAIPTGVGARKSSKALRWGVGTDGQAASLCCLAAGLGASPECLRQGTDQAREAGERPRAPSRKEEQPSGSRSVDRSRRLTERPPRTWCRQTRGRIHLSR